MWWTTFRLPGRASVPRNQTSSVNPGSTVKYLYGTTPWAGTVKGSGIFTTRVGLRNPPAVGKRALGRQLRRIPLGKSVVDPFVHELFVGLGQTRVVVELAVLGIGPPGGHSPLVDHFSNRLGPGGRVAVRRQSQRRDLSSTMARHAIGLEDPRDLIGVRHVARRWAAIDPTDAAAN